MSNIFKKEEILTIPNILSFARLLLIPLILWLYCIENNYYGALVIIIISGITDIADGFIARKFKMVSNFGKIIDPIADKVTQGSLILCLSIKYKAMLFLIGVFLFREILLIIMGAIILKKRDSVNSAKWFGKINTVVVYAVTTLLVILPNISQNIANIMISVSATTMLFSLVGYAIFYNGLFKK